LRLTHQMTLIIKVSPKNKQWVYIVHVAYRDGVGIRSITPYRCTVSDLFGGMGDHFRYTLNRAGTTGDQGYTKGSRVLVLCPNGDKSNALIVGGMRHTKDETSDPNNVFLAFQFNGVNVRIDSDGALSLVVSGATKTRRNTI